MKIFAENENEVKRSNDGAGLFPASTYQRVSLSLLMFYAVFRLGLNLYLLSGDCVDNPRMFTRGGESRIYTALAQSMISRREYNLGEGEAPFTRITPGYPFILALNMLVFGRYWIVSLFVTQICCVLAAVFLAYAICSRLRGHGAGLLAGFLVASYAPAHYFSLIIYREAFTFALLALFLYWIRPEVYHSGKTYWRLGLLIGVATIIREEQLLLLIPASVLIAWMECRSDRSRWRRALWRICVMGAFVPLVFSPWIIRNWITLNRLEMMSSNGGVHLYLGNSDEFTPGKPLDYGIYSRIPELKTMSENEVNRLYFHKALRYIAAHPARIAENAWYKLKLLYSASIRHMDDFPYILLAVLFGSVAAGLMRVREERRRHAVFAALLLLAFLVEKGFSFALFFPTVEFAVIPYFGLAGAAWMLFRREQPLYVLVYLLLMSVNIVFVPQHRHRWMIDLLTIIWTAVLLSDVVRFIEARYFGNDGAENIREIQTGEAG